MQTGQPELFVNVSEDLNRLNGFICVLENPFYAFADAKGSFKIAGFPAGTYTIEAAHPRTGKVSRETRIGLQNASGDFTLPGGTK